MKYIWLSYLLGTVLAGCNFINTDQNIPFEVLGESSGGKTTVNICRLIVSNLNLSNTKGLSAAELIITNRDEFDHYVTCNEEVKELNFDEYIVLAGKTTVHPHCVYIKEQRVLQSLRKLVYRVVIADMDCDIPDSAGYIVMISNKYLNYPIEFSIRKN